MNKVFKFTLQYTKSHGIYSVKGVYENDNLIFSYEFAKKFGSHLAQIKDRSVDKLAVLKNNRIEAVMLSKDEYKKIIYLNAIIIIFQERCGYAIITNI